MSKDGDIDEVVVEVTDGRNRAVCSCGGKTFEVVYGDYLCVGICTECGKESELYSG